MCLFFAFFISHLALPQLCSGYIFAIFLLLLLSRGSKAVLIHLNNRVNFSKEGKAAEEPNSTSCKPKHQRNDESVTKVQHKIHSSINFHAPQEEHH
eukprot:m.9837 g.9837  ORF g.9837 m.9837 type:complete len:96 (+) comp7272_c0_seq1:22-309(+)